MNLHATMFCCRYAGISMKNQRYGKIVTVRSIAGIRPRVTGTTPYGIAKAAIINCTLYLALELAPYNVTVNAVAPGFIATGLGGFGV